MTVLIICWFLFVFPAMLFLSALIGARLIAQGRSGETPSLSLPKFSVTHRGNGKIERDPLQRFPDL